MENNKGNIGPQSRSSSSI